MCGDKCVCVRLGWLCKKRQKHVWWCSSANELVCASMLIQRGQWWERPHQRFSSRVCVCVCVCVTLASLPELKEPAPDSEHTDTTQYCAGIECYGEKLSLEDWRWEINELQLKEGTRKKRRRFWAGDKEAEVRMYKWEVGNSKTWDKNKVIPRTNLDLARSKVLL